MSSSLGLPYLGGIVQACTAVVLLEALDEVLTLMLGPTSHRNFNAVPTVLTSETMSGYQFLTDVCPNVINRSVRRTV